MNLHFHIDYISLFENYIVWRGDVQFTSRIDLKHSQWNLYDVSVRSTQIRSHRNIASMLAHRHHGRPFLYTSYDLSQARFDQSQLHIYSIAFFTSADMFNLNSAVFSSSPRYLNLFYHFQFVVMHIDRQFVVR